MVALNEKLRLIGKSLSHAAQEGDLPAVAKWAGKAIALVMPAVTIIPKEPVSGDADLFVQIPANDAPYMIGGSPNNPNGVTMTLGQAKEFWEEVFAKGLNLSHVRPSLLPGSAVLTAAGKAAAIELSTESTDFAPESYNPLSLPVVP